MQLFEKMFHVNMSPRRIILIPIMCIIFVTYDIVMTYIKFMDGRQIDKSLLLHLLSGFILHHGAFRIQK